MHLRELLKTEDLTEKNKLLKRAFDALQKPISIDLEEVCAIHILANLSVPLTKLRDATDAKHAKRLLHDLKWLQRSAVTTEYKHSHNLKYPNYINRGVIRLNPIGNMPSGYISSTISTDTRLGWSHNSADINYQIFFGASFEWQNRITTIHELIREENSLFRELLLSAGMFNKDYNYLYKKFKQWTFRQSVTELGAEIRQIRVPYKHSYAAITPVAAHTLQRDIHLALSKEQKKRTIIRFSRPSSVGNLVSNAAGRLFNIHTYPINLNGLHTVKISSLNTRALFDLELLISTRNTLNTSNNKKTISAELRQRVHNFITRWQQQYAKGESTQKSVALFNLYLSKNKSWSRLAYMPEVTKLLHHLFNASAASEDILSENSNGSYLLLPALSVSHANAISSAYSVGLPSLIGIWGFLHAFERNVQEYCDPSFKMGGFSICLHTFSLHERGLIREQEFKSGKVTSPAILPTRQCDLELSLVLKIRSSQQLLSHQIVACLPNSFCQGAINPTIKNISQFKYFQSLFDASLATPHQEGRWLTLPKANETNHDFFNWLKQKSLLIGNVGYHFLEKPIEKKHVINDLPHAFAEPVLAQLETRRLHIDSDEADYVLTLRQTDHAVFLDTWSRHENS
ncbi:MAG: hypothetical protein NWQ54_20105 [Paraglaciecola sp.]|uniref:type I-F CRISPR-associated protein Csy2 n=1 Tax=Alishewanella sp. HL-SH05 TaxID=3461145 RepID=UPI0027526013|nr:hypothetical protein [Paraglaciecola sp.]